MVVLLILNEVEQEEDMSEVDKAISLVRLFRLPVVHWHGEIVEPSSMVHLEVLLNVVAGVPARYIAHHEICACLLAAHDPFSVDRSSIILSTRYKRLIGILLLQLLLMN